MKSAPTTAAEWLAFKLEHDRVFEARLRQIYADWERGGYSGFMMDALIQTALLRGVALTPPRQFIPSPRA